MTQANAVRSSRKHRSSSLSRCRKRQAGRHPSILHHATAIGRDAEAPYYHATLGKDSLRYVAKRANSALGATQPRLNQEEKALTARSPAARLLASRVETRRGRVGDATETNML